MFSESILGGRYIIRTRGACNACTENKIGIAYIKLIFCMLPKLCISTMRAHNINTTNSTRGYGETECDRKRKRSSFTVPEVVAAIGFVIVIMKPSCRNE